MEGLRVIQVFVGAMVFLGFVGVVLVVYAWGIRWLWRERGKGFAEGWFQVVDQRAGEQTADEAFNMGYEAGRRFGAKPVPAPAPGKPQSAESAKRAPVGPPRYLVPTEKE